MFATREGHAEGQVGTVFVALTDRSLYLLHQRASDRQFKTDAIVAFQEIDFVAVRRIVLIVTLITAIIERERCFI